jgi:hypothetical protein
MAALEKASKIYLEIHKIKEKNKVWISILLKIFFCLN